MSQEWVAILGLVALFAVGTVLPINMGALAYVAAWFVGVWSLNLEEKDILAGISADLVLTLIGVTYLFAIARRNGTVDLIVKGAVRAVGGRVVLIPWVMFAVTGVLTAIGAASPAAVAIIAPIALGFAARYSINPLMMGMMVVHGAQAGGFSPISIYGTITNSVVADEGLPSGELTIFFSSMVFNFLLATILFFLFGGRDLISRRVTDDGEGVTVEGGSGGSGRRERTEGSGSGSGSGSVATEEETEAPTRGASTEQVLTLVAFLAVAVVALAFDKNIGFVSITAAVALAILSPRKQQGAVSEIAWPTVLLVAGVSTYATILETAGSPEYVGNWAAGLGAAALGALILCYVGGVVSAFASSTALLPIIIPLAIPLVTEHNISAIAIVAAVAVSSTIVDVSPFSTNGALVLANRPDTIPEERFYKQILTYSFIVVAVGPLLAWAALVAPGWL
jgi:di/tricarboxylate transporter